MDELHPEEYASKKINPIMHSMSSSHSLDHFLSSDSEESPEMPATESLEDLAETEMEVAELMVAMSNSSPQLFPPTILRDPQNSSSIPITTPSYQTHQTSSGYGYPRRTPGIAIRQPMPPTHLSNPYYPPDWRSHTYPPTEYHGGPGRTQPVFPSSLQYDSQSKSRGRRTTVTKRLVTSPSGDACSNCGVESSTLWRNCPLLEGARYLCNACGLRYKKGKYCPLCFKVYYDVDTNHLQWKQCIGCLNWTHLLCLQRTGWQPKNENDPYECSACSKKSESQPVQGHPVE